MPPTRVVLYVDDDGAVPVLDWLDDQLPKVQEKCIAVIEQLEEHGFELRRPQADFLRDGIYELRVRFQSVHYRLLYFFHEKTAVISHGITKKKEVPSKEIDRALGNKERFAADPGGRTHQEANDEKEEEHN